MNRPNFLCLICSKSFPKRGRLQAHATVHTKEKPFNCSLCGKNFSSRSNLHAHTRRKHEGHDGQKRFRCNLCQYEIHTEDQLIDHMTKHTGERPFKCTADGCEKTFKVESTLRQHVSYRHSNERPFKCDFLACRYTAKTPQDLIVHNYGHRDDRPFACPNAGCSYRAKYMQLIQRHIASVHSENKTFACSKCDFKTAHKGALKGHVLRLHSTTREFKCSHPLCTESFKTLSDMKRHFSNRHGERNIKCDHLGCSGKFSNARALISHKKTVHSKKSIDCPKVRCKFRTNTTATLAHHMIRHDRRSQNIPCSVESCEFKGKNSLAIELHMRHHMTHFACPLPGCSRKTFTERAFKDHIKLHNPVGKPFQCPLCSQHFPTWTRLFRHSFVHTNEKPLKCGHCEFTSSTRADLKRHISSVHASIKFPVIVLPSNVHQCLGCKVKLPFAEFLVHCMGHVVPVVMIERLELKRS